MEKLEATGAGSTDTMAATKAAGEAKVHGGGSFLPVRVAPGLGRGGGDRPLHHATRFDQRQSSQVEVRQRDGEPVTGFRTRRKRGEGERRPPTAFVPGAHPT